jgi:hypothetical protein
MAFITTKYGIGDWVKLKSIENYIIAQIESIKFTSEHTVYEVAFMEDYNSVNRLAKITEDAIDCKVIITEIKE